MKRFALLLALLAPTAARAAAPETVESRRFVAGVTRFLETEMAAQVAAVQQTGSAAAGRAGRPHQGSP